MHTRPRTEPGSSVLESLQHLTCLLAQKLMDLPEASVRNGSDVAVGQDHGCAILHLAHHQQGELEVLRDVGTRAAPVHARQQHLQVLCLKETQAHLLVTQHPLQMEPCDSRVQLLDEFGEPTHDGKVTAAKARQQLPSRPAGFAQTPLKLWAAGFAVLVRAEVVVVAVAAAVDEGQALFGEAVVGPARLPVLAGALHGRQQAHALTLPLARRPALLVRLKAVAAVLAASMSKRLAFAPGRIVEPVHTLLAALTPLHGGPAVGRRERLAQRQTRLRVVEQIAAGALHDGQRVIGPQRSGRVPHHAGVNPCVPHLGVVHHQLANVGHDHVPVHLVRPHEDALSSLGLLLPGDVGPRLSDGVTVEASRAAGVHHLLLWARVEHRREGLGAGGRGLSRGVLRQGAGLGAGQVIAAGDLGERDALNAGLGVHVAVVEVGEAVGGAGEAGLALTVVLTFTHRLALPHLAHRPLLAALEPGAAGLATRRDACTRLTVVRGAVRET